MAGVLPQEQFCLLTGPALHGKLTMVEEELGERQQRPLAACVCAQLPIQGLEAGEAAIQEGGVLPTYCVQHPHGFHQALWGQGQHQRGGALTYPCHPALATYCFLQVGVPLPQGSWGQEEVSCRSLPRSQRAP